MKIGGINPPGTSGSRWTGVVTLDVNHARRYYTKYDQIIQM